jgi:hypothetical protein
MDNRFIFLYRPRALKPDELEGRPSAALELSASKLVGGKPLRGDRKLAGKPKGDLAEPREPRKGLVEPLVDRTANRHRWAGVRTSRRTGDPSLRNSAN